MRLFSCQSWAARFISSWLFFPHSCKSWNWICRAPMSESEWPAYTREQPIYKILNAERNDVGKGPRTTACAFWNDFLPRLSGVPGTVDYLQGLFPLVWEAMRVHLHGFLISRSATGDVRWWHGGIEHILGCRQNLKSDAFDSGFILICAVPRRPNTQQVWLEKGNNSKLAPTVAEFGRNRAASRDRFFTSNSYSFF